LEACHTREGKTTHTGTGPNCGRRHTRHTPIIQQSHTSFSAAVNDAPAAANLTFTAAEDTALNVAAPGLLANASDVDGGAAPSVDTTPVSAPSYGTVTLFSNGSFVYVPNPNFNGTDSFTYRVVDANGTYSATATITVGVGAFV
jgi:hypothetical protein